MFAGRFRGFPRVLVDVPRCVVDLHIAAVGVPRWSVDFSDVIVDLPDAAVDVPGRLVRRNDDRINQPKRYNMFVIYVIAAWGFESIERNWALLNVDGSAGRWFGVCGFWGCRDRHIEQLPLFFDFKFY
jgi:hypothetical protein